MIKLTWQVIAFGVKWKYKRALLNLSYLIELKGKIMEQHIIIIDLDGTLMLDFSHYEEETIAYLKKESGDL